MLANLEALAALARQGTMTRAALALHITQSAVSRRIATLEYELELQLIEKTGRRVRLTPAGLTLLNRTRPLMEELREAFLEQRAVVSGRIEIAVSVSVLISGAARVLGLLRESMPQIELSVQAHHASVAVEKVRSGEVLLALVQGQSEIAPDLHALPYRQQELVIVPSGLKKLRFPKKGALPVMAIEEYTEAWRFTGRSLREQSKVWGIKIAVESQVQSFSAIAEMAKAGFGHGLVPIGVARALGIQERDLLRFPKPGLRIPISLVGRQSTLDRPLVQEFYQQLAKHQAD